MKPKKSKLPLALVISTAFALKKTTDHMGERPENLIAPAIELLIAAEAAIKAYRPKE